MLDRAVERVGRAPKYTVSNQGPQFRGEYGAWCKRHGVKHRPSFGMFHDVAVHSSARGTARAGLATRARGIVQEAIWIAAGR